MQHYLEVALEESEVGCLYVLNSLNTEYGYRLIDGDKFVTRKHTLEFRYDYPLERSVRFTHIRKGGWRKKDIIRTIQQDYKHIYKEDGKCVDGVYGVWGHDIGDLMIEAFDIKGNIVYPHIGS